MYGAGSALSSQEYQGWDGKRRKSWNDGRLAAGRFDSATAGPLDGWTVDGKTAGQFDGLTAIPDYQPFLAKRTGMVWRRM